MRKYRRITYEERLVIDFYIKMGYSVWQIAKLLDRTARSIYLEMEKGSVNGTYDPELAQKVTERRVMMKSQGTLFDQHIGLAQYVSDCILNHKMSPQEIVDNVSFWPLDNYTGIIRSVNTIYSAIKRGDIPGVTMETLRDR